jgi:hypothetical protein
MSNERNEIEEIERQFEQIIERLIALLPTDGRTKIIRKEANRREKVRIEVRATKAKEDELHRIYVAAATFAAPPAPVGGTPQGRGGRPSVIPGSFKLLVIGR